MSRADRAGPFPDDPAAAAGVVRRTWRTARKWLAEYLDKARTQPGELVLAIIVSLWAAVLWAPKEAFQPGSVFIRVETLLHGEPVTAAICTLLAAGQWAGLVLDGWSPRYRANVLFASLLWWLFVTLEAAWSRWYSPVWCTTLGVVAINAIVYMRIRAELVRAEFALSHRRKTRATP